MLNKKKILTVLSLTQVRRSKTFIGNGFTCFKGSTYCLVNVTGPITLVHTHLCGHKLQYIYQLYSAMFRVEKRVLVANPLVRSHMMDTILKYSVALTG